MGKFENPLSINKPGEDKSFILNEAYLTEALTRNGEINQNLADMIPLELADINQAIDKKFDIQEIFQKSGIQIEEGSNLHKGLKNIAEKNLIEANKAIENYKNGKIINSDDLKDNIIRALGNGISDYFKETEDSEYIKSLKQASSE